ncbi:MAG: AmmeMemoRadiSam system protein B [Planctomycetota bacterium]
MSDEPAGNEPKQTPVFDPDAAHMVRPKLRAVRGFPLQANGPDGQPKPLLGLADARQISDRIVATAPAFQVVLPMLDGSRSVDQIVTEVGRGLQTDQLQGFVAQLDDAGLLEGPTFEALENKLHQQFDETDILPPGKTAEYADQLVMAAMGQEATDEQKAAEGPNRLRAWLDECMNKALESAQKPSYDALPAVLVAPQADYRLAWPNYAAAWGRARVVDRPDRVIVLGTNNFGACTGVCGCDKGFASPLGESMVDAELVGKLRNSLGDKFFESRFDHEREHSVEAQMPWIHHCLGAGEDGAFPMIFAALVHDPAVNNGESYDGNGVSLEGFVEAVRGAIGELGGKTLIVVSADLSHVGRAYGDQMPLVGEDEEAKSFRDTVVRTDRDHLTSIQDGKLDELITTIAWQQNPTRWNSLGSLVAAHKIAQPSKTEVLNYMAAVDQQGISLVSSAAMAMFA